MLRRQSKNRQLLTPRHRLDQYVENLAFHVVAAGFSLQRHRFQPPVDIRYVHSRPTASMASALWSRVALPSLRVAAGGAAAALFGTGATTTLMAAYASYNIHAKRPRNYADDFVRR